MGPSPKYAASGRQKYDPLTDRPGSIANDSVRVMPAQRAASSKSKRVASLVWSGQAG